MRYGLHHSLTYYLMINVKLASPAGIGLLVLAIKKLCIIGVTIVIFTMIDGYITIFV